MLSQVVAILDEHLGQPGEWEVVLGMETDTYRLQHVGEEDTNIE